MSTSNLFDDNWWAALANRDFGYLEKELQKLEAENPPAVDLEKVRRGREMIASMIRERDVSISIGDTSTLEDIPGITPSVDCRAYGQWLYPSSEDIEIHWSAHSYEDAEKA